MEALKKGEHVSRKGNPKKRKYCRTCRQDTLYTETHYGYECEVCGEFTSTGRTLGQQCSKAFSNLVVKKK